MHGTNSSRAPLRCAVQSVADMANQNGSERPHQKAFPPGISVLTGGLFSLTGSDPVPRKRRVLLRQVQRLVTGGFGQIVASNGDQTL